VEKTRERCRRLNWRAVRWWIGRVFSPVVVCGAALFYGWRAIWEWRNGGSGGAIFFASAAILVAVLLARDIIRKGPTWRYPGDG